MAMTNFVKFIRGTSAAYAKLTTPDSDTLYFIIDAGQESGLLYLGSKLISNGSVNALGSVVIESVADKDLLVYDEDKAAWVNSSVEDVIGIMTGATSTTDGKSGMVPAPVAGEQAKFLRGDGTWATPMSYTASQFEVKYDSSLNGTLSLLNFNSAAANTIAIKGSDGNLNWVAPSSLGLGGSTLSRKIVSSVDAINTDATDADSYIYMVPNGNTDGNDVYNEYILVNGKLELMGSTSPDLTGYVKTSELNSKIQEVNNTIDSMKSVLGMTSTGCTTLDRIKAIEDDYVTLTKYKAEVGDISLLTHVASEDSTIIDEVNDLNVRLSWQQMTE